MIYFDNYITPLYTENVGGSSPSSPTIFFHLKYLFPSEQQ